MLRVNLRTFEILGDGCDFFKMMAWYEDFLNFFIIFKKINPTVQYRFGYRDSHH